MPGQVRLPTPHICLPESLDQRAKIRDGVVAIFDIRCVGQRCGSVADMEVRRQLCLELLGEAVHVNPTSQGSRMHAPNSSISRAPA